VTAGEGGIQSNVGGDLCVYVGDRRRTGQRHERAGPTTLVENLTARKKRETRKTNHGGKSRTRNKTRTFTSSDFNLKNRTDGQGEEGFSEKVNFKKKGRLLQTRFFSRTAELSGVRQRRQAKNLKRSSGMGLAEEMQHSAKKKIINQEHKTASEYFASRDRRKRSQR